MKTVNFTRLAFAPMVVAGLALLQLASAGSSFAAANCIKGEHKPPFKLGWANIYSIPTWMKETTGTIEDMANELKKQGLVESLTITDAQGNANTQIQQIQSMIDANLDAILVEAGSATALNRVIARLGSSARVTKRSAVVSAPSGRRSPPIRRPRKTMDTYEVMSPLG